MGFLKDLVGIAAPIAGTIIGGPVGGAIGGALGGLASGSGQPKAQTSTTQQQLDPRISQMLFGNGGSDKGLLAQYQGMLNQPRSQAGQNFATANEGYLNGYGGADLDASRYAAYRAMQGNQAPTMQAAQATGGYATIPAYAVGEKVNAPGQNNLDLTGSYNSLVNGAPGANPYLTGAIQKGINQSSAAFGNMLADQKSATQDLLGNIRGGAIAAGQYGGSRQALAEGKAIDSFNTNTSRAAAQFGQNNTDAAVAAQAGAYNSDRDRQLAATQGLSGQQYGVAQQEAGYAQQAQMQNVQNSFDASKTNANMYQQNNQFNAGLQQQAGLANQQSQLTTNAQNNGQLLGGAGLLSGLLGQASGQVNANDNWGLNRAQGVNSLLAPYLGANSSTTNSQPLYSNSTGNALGGAMLGANLSSLFGGGTDYSAIRNSNGAGTPAPSGLLPTGWAPSNLPVMPFPFG